MKTKNTILCSTLALILCSTVNVFAFNTSIFKADLQKDMATLTSAVDNSISTPFYDKQQKELAIQLINAVKNNDEDTFKVTLQEMDKKYVNYQDNTGYTAFMWAVEKENEKFAKSLFPYSDLNIQSNSGNTALILAVDSLKRGMIDLILDEIDESKNDWLTETNTVDLNIQTKNGWNALMYAIENKDTKTVKHLINMKDSDGNYRVTLDPKKLKKPFGDGNSFLIMSTFYNRDADDNGEIFEMLLNAKDSEGNYRTDVNYVTELGYTALSMTAYFKNVKYNFFEKILNAKDSHGNYRMTNLNSRNYLANPLFRAIVGKNLEAVKSLVWARDTNGEYRVDLNVKINENIDTVGVKKGDTALIIATKVDGQIASYLADITYRREHPNAGLVPANN